jgi:hypothetical protein
MTARQILVEVHLPPVLSYADPSDPQLTMSMTLLNSSAPITISPADTGLFPIVNCFTIWESDTGNVHQLPRVDRQRKGPPLTSTPEEIDRLVTLYPDILQVFSNNFRPFGHEILTPERIAAMGDRRYRAMALGMHLLKIGRAYRLNVDQGLQIYAWVEGDKKDLFPGKWKPSGVPIPVVTKEESVEFRVESEALSDGVQLSAGDVQ